MELFVFVVEIVCELVGCRKKSCISVIRMDVIKCLL